MDDAKRRLLTMMLVTAAIVAVGVVLVLQLLSDDERPIRVRNGSMEILAAASQENEWGWKGEQDGDNTDPSPSYSHEPRDRFRDRDKDLWVKVTTRSGTCAQGNTASGRVVRVHYSENNFIATFRRGRSGWYDYRTKVRPRSGLTLDPNGRVLRHGTAGAGSITSVRVGEDWQCEFNSATVLEEITICASRETSECQ
jgi:hypothetical protein